MGREKQRKILSRVRSGKLSVKEALEQLRQETVDELGFATLDLQRALRRGFPEVVLGEGKTPSQIADITRSLRRAGQTVLITRLGPDVARGLVQSFPGADRAHNRVVSIPIYPSLSDDEVDTIIRAVVRFFD